MSCAVYCLVRSPEQLEPLVDRLTGAGVGAENISVVVRKDGSTHRSLATPSECIGSSLWDLSFGPAALWWPLVMCGWGFSWPVANEHVVVPLDVFRQQLRK